MNTPNIHGCPTNAKCETCTQARVMRAESARFVWVICQNGNTVRTQPPTMAVKHFPSEQEAVQAVLDSGYTLTLRYNEPPTAEGKDGWPSLYLRHERGAWWWQDAHAGRLP